VRFKLVFQGLKSDGNPEQFAHIIARNPALMKVILALPTRLAVVARGRVACDRDGQMYLEALSVQPTQDLFQKRKQFEAHQKEAASV
jgi:hypothetical protein